MIRHLTAALALLLALGFTPTAGAQADPASEGTSLTCSHANPVGLFTDFCYDSMFPIRLMGMIDTPFVNDVWPPLHAAKYDFPPAGCFCTVYVFGVPVEVPGTLRGAWIPVQVIEATRAPGCVVMGGGFSFSQVSSLWAKSGGEAKQDVTGANTGGFRNFTMYDFPLASAFAGMLGMTQCAAIEPSMESVMSSLLLPFWNRSDLANLLFPESFLFANVAGVLTGPVSCAASTTGLGFVDDFMFWSMGCWGRTYPLTGAYGSQGEVSGSSLIVGRAMYTMGAMSRYMGNFVSKYGVTTVGNWVANNTCTPLPTPVLIKSEWKVGQIFPVPESGLGVATVSTPSAGTAANISPIGMLLSRCAHRLGASEHIWGSYRKAQITGEDQAYLVWRWVDCCML